MNLIMLNTVNHNRLDFSIDDSSIGNQIVTKLFTKGNIASSHQSFLYILLIIIIISFILSSIYILRKRRQNKDNI